MDFESVADAVAVKDLVGLSREGDDDNECCTEAVPMVWLNVLVSVGVKVSDFD